MGEEGGFGDAEVGKGGGVEGGVQDVEGVEFGGGRRGEGGGGVGVEDAEGGWA